MLAGKVRLGTARAREDVLTLLKKRAWLSYRPDPTGNGFDPEQRSLLNDKVVR